MQTQYRQEIEGHTVNGEWDLASLSSNLMYTCGVPHTPSMPSVCACASAWVLKKRDKRCI